MLEITLNGATRQISADTSIKDLLQELALEKQRLAVEVNLEIIPRSRHAETVLNNHDRVEIVRAIGGG